MHLTTTFVLAKMLCPVFRLVLHRDVQESGEVLGMILGWIDVWCCIQNSDPWHV